MKLNIKNILVYCTYLILLVCILYLFLNLKSSTNKINKDLENIISNVHSENWEETSNLFNEFKENHSKKIRDLSSIVRHDEVNKALLSLVEISTNIDLKNKNECLNNLNKLYFYISSFYKNQIPSLINVL